MRSERTSGSRLKERRGGTESKMWGSDSDRCGEEEQRKVQMRKS